MVYRKTKSTEERKEARRRLILDAATRLFGKHGYHATTVPMIVAESESSTGSFYMYFRNKEDVFAAALEELGEKIERLMNEARESRLEVPLQMEKGIESLFVFLAQNPERARILIVESSGLSPRLEAIGRRILRHQADHVRQMLESEPSLFDVGNTMIAGQCIVGAAYEALYCWLEEDPELRMAAVEVARSVAQFTMRAINGPSVNAG